MESFIEFLKLPNSWSVVVASIVFSLPLAAAYTIFISDGLWKVKPKWLFYVLFPTLILLFKLLELNTAIIIIVLFPLLFLFVLLGFVVAFILNFKKRLKEEKLKNILTGLAKTLLFLGLLVLSWLYFGPVTILFVIAYTFLSDMFFPGEKNRFLNIQAALPTSKLDSMAMGLVEVKGQTIMQDPMLSPIDEKKCIGYRLVIEKVRHDDNGRHSYTTISDEVFCNDFIIKDKTGEARVKADGINFIWLEADKHRSRASKRYTQYLLLDHQDILLIGKANAGAEGPFIEKESIKDIFTLAPYNKVTKWNVNKPLLNSFMTYLVMLFLLIALILMSDLTITDNLVIFNLAIDDFSLNNLLNNQHMTALPYQSLPFLKNMIDMPVLMVVWAAFGVPLIIFLLIFLSKFYRQYKISSYIDSVIFSSLFFTWIAGFILMILFLFAKVSGVKLYFIWITVFVSSLVFSIINNRALVKYLGLLNDKNPVKK